MPAPVKIKWQERQALARRLARAIAGTGLSRREVARRIAMSRDAKPATIEANLKRWTGEARENAIDAAPDWVFLEIAKIEPPTPGEIECDLRAAISKGYVSMALAVAAADAISTLLAKPVKKKGRVG